MVVTCGDDRALFSRGTKPVHLPAFVVSRDGLPGAGDAFNGALACALAEGMESKRLWSELMQRAR